MTVKELRELLDTLPEDARVYRQGDEYNGDYRGVSKVEYNKEASLAGPGHSVFIR
jgi:hypothetical protein